MWLGIKSIHRSLTKPNILANLSPSRMSLSGVFKAGFVTAVTNPKAIAYFSSIFAATGVSALPIIYQIIAVVLTPTIAFFWYGSLALLASHASIKNALGKSQHWLDGAAGLVMVGFGIKLLMSSTG